MCRLCDETEGTTGFTGLRKSNMDTAARSARVSIGFLTTQIAEFYCINVGYGGSVHVEDYM